MSVLIKGMEMPTSCEKCPFLDYEEGFCFATVVKGKSGWYESKLCPGGIKDGRHADCPLVPVPPHGKLGDLDVLYAHMCKAHDKWRENPAQYMSINPFTDDETMVLYAPTIIPADPAKEGK